MKAIVYNKYGNTENLKLEEVQKPEPKENEVLIKVAAAAVNSWDWDRVRGRPYVLRFEGLTKPKYPIIGCDVAGIVEHVGADVKRLKVGDEVFGDLSTGAWGGFAEYVCADENVLAIKPENMSFEDAAAIPQAGVLALQGLKKGGIRSGMKILINGAGGGVGTIGLQIAKHYGAEVTCVDKAEKLDLLKNLGADEVIDYKTTDFRDMGIQYDLILDNVASPPLSKYCGALKADGKFIVIGGKSGMIFRVIVFGKMIKRFRGKEFSLLLHKPNREDLVELSELYLAGKMKPVIGHRFELSETPEAIKLIADGDVIGKAVIFFDKNLNEI